MHIFFFALIIINIYIYIFFFNTNFEQQSHFVSLLCCRPTDLDLLKRILFLVCFLFLFLEYFNIIACKGKKKKKRVTLLSSHSQKEGIITQYLNTGNDRRSTNRPWKWHYTILRTVYNTTFASVPTTILFENLDLLTFRESGTRDRYCVYLPRAKTSTTIECARKRIDDNTDHAGVCFSALRLNLYYFERHLV